MTVDKNTNYDKCTVPTSTVHFYSSVYKCTYNFEGDEIANNIAIHRSSQNKTSALIPAVSSFFTALFPTHT